MRKKILKTTVLFMFTITNCFAEFPRTQKRYSEKSKITECLINTHKLSPVELNMFKEPDGEECKIELGVHLNTMPEMAGYKYHI